MSTAELACSYAALILADDGVEITADKIQTLLGAAKVAEIEPIWASLFAKALDGKDVKDLLTNVGSGGAAAAAPVAGGAAAAAPAEAAAEEKEEEKEESDEDMGFGLFD
ncbi:ribosomal protein P1 [Aspergillus clavatus NRRL 1]|uniref:Large ribosomal subunit protein P1 n=1 Tax=Aspergillus clavatus (strain ATCC 1007 / CBS 513.65 / DSM 816 / NCTC 3887 / NRRL 1 / QM 1276 / 107) TaxID=344612 RepID=A1CQX8_ASPCL|nr:60S acidic ribosomal protein P1 [Aspergillus clavatus NRRL 1]EAW08049.1 60S acidic ribosomal protein P1 [Aspergillus clavatus NRRL 1]